MDSDILNHSPNRFICRGSGGLGNTGLGPKSDKFRNSADNFYAQARYFVHVASLPCRRNGRSRHFLQKNTMVSAHFASQPRKWSWWLKDAPDGFRGLLGAPPELSRGAPKVPSGILLPGFFLQDSSSEIPPQEILLEDSSSRIPPPGFHLKDSSLRIPPPGSLL